MRTKILRLNIWVDQKFTSFENSQFNLRVFSIIFLIYLLELWDFTVKSGAQKLKKKLETCWNRRINHNVKLPFKI